MIIGRLVVDLFWQWHGIGTALLRTIQGSEIADVKALLVHAITNQAVIFYKKMGIFLLPYQFKDSFFIHTSGKGFCEMWIITCPFGLLSTFFIRQRKLVL